MVLAGTGVNNRHGWAVPEADTRQGIPGAASGGLGSRMRRNLSLAAALSWIALAAGCASEQPWRGTIVYPDRVVPPPVSPPPIVHCTDSVGHLRGTWPYIFGGTCCCNPSLELLAAYGKDGFLKGWSVDALRAAYKRRGIATIRDHRQCNNLCEQGPHVVKGGRCLVPPTPGTLNHEEVLTGSYGLTPWEARQAAAHGPLDRGSMAPVAEATPEPPAEPPEPGAAPVAGPRAGNGT